MPDTTPPPGSLLVWSTADGRYDGQWWPPTRDATAELARLLPELERQTNHTITRATLSMAEWSGRQPRRLAVSGHLLRIGWFPRLPPNTATFGHSTGARIVLEVRREAPLTGIGINGTAHSAPGTTTRA